MEIDFRQTWYLPVAAHAEGVTLGEQLLPEAAELAGLPVGPLPVAALQVAVHDYAVATRGQQRPPFAALVAFVTGDPAALHPCFPLTRTLSSAELAAFDMLVAELAWSPVLDLRLFDAKWGRNRELILPTDAAMLVAGHLAELFFYRRDLLEGLLAAQPHIWLYTTPRAYSRGGGVGGGCYSPGEGAIKLMLARLYEGFSGPTPGVAPLLHELGHLLDCLHLAGGALGSATGSYPGLRPVDGPAYTPEAHALFAQGKALEAARYRRRAAGVRDEPAPIGHPYVFQNDGEFLAGYLELFLRCPNAFAAQNPTLYAGYTALFGQDPRRAWARDFPFYVEANRQFYAGEATPPPDGLTLAGDNTERPAPAQGSQP
jgi:hypothetical protein